MIFALDFDGTYTADPELWDQWVRLCRKRGHRVYVVTMRYPSESVPDELAESVDRVIYTGRRAKKQLLDARGISIDIWIDDRPEFLFEDAAP